MAVPSVKVYVDWDNDGTFGGAQEARDNVSDYVDWMRAKRSASNFMSPSAPSELVINLRNETGRFSPDNSGGPLYGELDVGKRVWVQCTYSSVDYGLFAGYIDRIVPLPDERRCQITVKDLLARWRRTPVYVSPSSSRNVKGLRGAVLDGLGLTAGQRSLVGNGHECDWTGSSGTGRDKKNALGILEECNDATMTRHFIRPSATGSTWFQYVTRDRNWALDAAPSEDITYAESMDGYEVNDQTVINEVRVEVDYIEPEDRSIIWRLKEDVVLTESDPPVWFIEFVGGGGPIVPGDDGKKGVEPGVRDHWYSRHPVNVTEQNTKTIWAHFEDDVEFLTDAVMRVSYTPVTAGYSVVMTNYGDRVKFVLTAGSGSGDLVVKWIALSGRVGRRRDVLAVESSNATSQSRYGVRTPGPVKSMYLTGVASADGVADHIIWRRKNPRKTPTVTIRNQFPAMLQRDPYDIVSLTYSRLSVSARKFEVVGIDWTVKDGGATWLWKYHLMELPVQATMTFFKLGGTADEGVGGTGILAY